VGQRITEGVTEHSACMREKRRILKSWNPAERRDRLWILYYMGRLY